MKYLVALATLAGASPIYAQELTLHLPIDCELGKTCFIQHYTDRDTGPEAKDYTCGTLSYDGHKGTDFALPTHADRLKGVNVLAAAAGKVRGVRDGIPDMGLDDTPAELIDGKDCGNGVVIDHGNGWETQYCHMASGSVQVKEGDQVETGALLGLVGYSGRTQFPHLHLSVRQNGEVVDPFASGADTCADSGLTMWDIDIAYQPTAIFDLGLSDAVPQYGAIKQGLPKAEVRRDEPLVLWGYAFGAKPGDVMGFLISGPHGEVFRHDVLIDRQQAQYFRAGGLKAPLGGWPSGRYTGLVTLTRDGKVLDRRPTQTEIN